MSTAGTEGSGTPSGPRAGWLSRNLLVLCGVSLLQDAASELLYPILPIFLTVTLGAPAAAVGIVEGAAEAGGAATKLVAGRLADTHARRPLIGSGYGLAALGKIVLAAATVWPLALLARVIDRLGKGVRGAPRDALLVVGVSPGDRGKAFGLHRAADTTGAVIGPLLGLGLYELFDQHIRPLLVVAIIPAVASVVLVAAVREAPSRRVATSSGRSARPWSGLWSRLPRRFWTVAGPLMLFALVNFPDALLLLRAHEVGLSVVGVIGAYVVYNVSYALLSYPAGAVSDRRSRPLVFAVGLACFTITYLGLGLTHNPVWVWPLLLVYGGFPACTDSVGKAWISTTVTPTRQGSAQGVYQALSGVGVLAAGLWAGLAWGADGRIPLLVSGSVAAALTLALPLAARHRIPAPPT